MDYRVLFKEKNDEVTERFELVSQRIREIPSEENVPREYRTYFTYVAEFIRYVNNLATRFMKGAYPDNSWEWQDVNARLFGDILPGRYEESFANPDHCSSIFPEKYGKYLCFLYTDIRSIVPFAFEHRLFEMTLYEELFVEIYNMFEAETLPEEEALRDTIYWFNSDYAEIFMEDLAAEQYNPEFSFARDIVMGCDLSDVNYLYRYGEYISGVEMFIAKYLNGLPEEKIALMADTMTEGYRKGFELAGKDLSKKKYASVHYAIGFERVIRRVIENLEKMGLTALIYRAPIQSIARSRMGRNGFYSTSPNRQYDYDHKDDIALYYDGNFAERKFDELRKAYDANKGYMRDYAGPAVLEVFGEEPFAPVDKEAAFKLNADQRKLRVKYMSKSKELLTEYVNYKERSFTIIAFPTPEICGADDNRSDYVKIFDEVIRLNTLDYNLYRDVQQKMIDLLDKSDYVRIKGMAGNKSNLKVSLCGILDPGKETKFENCVADVNIPVGEVFTSPRLTGTAGKLHVTSVYLNGLLFKDLEVDFADGMIESVSCANFDDEAQNKRYIDDNLLFNHKTLPMGEFAIGTNTTAYVMAEKYDIAHKLPILIAEKMGPHFAVGDTCYSLNEDLPVFNPDGKEIVCRDNEITSKYRKTDMSKAYFNCHTDITIPYRELGSIIAYDSEGNETLIIENGRFVLPGTEVLNDAFEEL
ncbi:MAG: aminopeptidase [Lachnospiraceae bacterium]|nr:aminopeptidase [Lachnospiraceae bacterium]